MGTFVVFLTTIFLLLGVIWYKIYVQKRASKDSALIYVLERLIAKDKELTSDSILIELKDIVVQRDEVPEDRFHSLIERSKILNMETPLKMEDLFKEVSDVLSKELNLKPEEIFEKLTKREKESSTVIRKGLAIPHIIVEGKNLFKILVVRAKAGIIFPDDKLAHIIFVLAGSSDERNFHLKVLAAIAQITQQPEFDKKWLEAINEDDLRNIVLLAERRRG
ncbi:hypothetical protein ES703_67399 [subsurface metagenome]